MNYYFSKIIQMDFESALEQVAEALKAEGFGILTEIDVKATMKKKLDVDFHPYKILGACNPPIAHKALQAEDKVGTMLPCNIIVQEQKPGQVEVAAVNPRASLQAIENPALNEIADTVEQKLKSVIATL